MSRVSSFSMRAHTIRFDAKFRAAIEYACGETLVCDTLEVARNICYERNEKIKGMLRRALRRALSRAVEPGVELVVEPGVAAGR